MKAILFDFWGTLVETGVWSPVRQVRNILHINMPFALYIIEFEKIFMTQPFETLHDGFSALTQKLRLQCDPNQLNELVGLWNKNWMLAKPYPETVEILGELKKKYKLFLLANTDPFSVKNVMKKYQMEQLFDKVYLSCETGFLKTNTQLYDTIAQEQGIDKSEMVMIGDTMETDVIGPRNAGVKSILIDRNNNREFSPKIQNLTEIETALTLFE